MSNLHNNIRSETRPQSWKSLQQDQQNAIRRLTALLVESLKKIPPDEDHPDAPQWLEHNRSSRVAFLSGSRGSGKSTVLASLIHASSSRDWLKEVENSSFSEELEGLQKQVVWLEPLDMEPHPEPMNLLAAILVRVQDAVYQYQKSEVPNPRRRNHDDYRDAPDSLSKVQQQIDREVQRVAAAWDENYAEVRSRLTPEDYQEQVLVVEKSRLHLNRDLRRVLRAAGNEIQTDRGSREDILFVLPIDDFDLSPTSCLHSLRLLRMLSIPNLFCLLVGDLDVLLPVLQLKYASDFQRAYRSAPLATLPGNGTQLSAMAQRAAANGMTKLLPVAQRIYLTSLNVHQGMRYAAVSDGDSNREEIWHLLLKLPLPLSDCGTLFEFLFPPAVRGKPNRELSLDQLETNAYDYSGLHLFSGTNRELTDLWHLLNQLREGFAWLSKPEELTPTQRLDVAHAYQEFLIRCIEEESHKSATNVGQSFSDAQAFGGNQLLIEHQRLRIGIPEDSSDRRMPSVRIASAGWYQVGVSLELRARRQSPGLFMEAQTDASVPQGQSPFARKFSERAYGAIALLFDLTQTFESRIAFLEDLSFDDIVWMSCDWAVGVDTHLNRSVPWIAPRFRTFRELDRFQELWSVIIDQHVVPLKRESRDSTLEVAYAWISACIASLTGVSPVEPDYIEFEKTWWNLFRELDHRVPDSTNNSEESRSFRDWLVELAVILSPPAGMLSGGFPCCSWYKTPENQQRFEKACPNIALVWQERQQYISKKITAAIATACRGLDPVRDTLLGLVGEDVHVWGFFTSKEALARIDRGDWNFNPTQLAKRARDQAAKRKGLKGSEAT